MERAKRLELRPANSEERENSSVANFANEPDTQLSTHASELAEIAAIWPRLSREFQMAVITMIRSQRAGGPLLSAPSKTAAQVGEKAGRLRAMGSNRSSA